jgi:hypothetical protein
MPLKKFIPIRLPEFAGFLSFDSLEEAQEWADRQEGEVAVMQIVSRLETVSRWVNEPGAELSADFDCSAATQPRIDPQEALRYAETLKGAREKWFAQQAEMWNSVPAEMRNAVPDPEPTDKWERVWTATDDQVLAHHSLIQNIRVKELAKYFGCSCDEIHRRQAHLVKGASQK